MKSFLSRYGKSVVILLIPCLLFWGLSLLDQSSSSTLGVFFGEMDLSKRHYFMFPLVVALLTFVLFQRWSAAIVGVACILPVMIFGSRYVFSFAVDTSYPGVVLARLNKDVQEAKTLRLREQVLRFLPEEFHESIERHFAPIRAHKGAIRRFPSAPAVVWGDGKRVKVSFQDSEVNSETFPRTYGNRSVPVEIVTTLPGLDLSFEPVQQTGLYLSRLIQSFELEKRGASFEELEQVFLETTVHQSTWDSYVHLAYPWWKLGNMYLERSFGGPRDTVLSKCARDAYGESAALISPGAYPLFRAAVFNNKAAALLLDESEPLKQKRKKEIRQLLHTATLIVHRKGKWRPSKYVVKAIKTNLKAIKVLSGKKPKLKKKNKKNAKQRRRNQSAGTVRSS